MQSQDDILALREPERLFSAPEAVAAESVAPGVRFPRAVALGCPNQIGTDARIARRDLPAAVEEALCLPVALVRHGPTAEDARWLRAEAEAA